MQLKHILLFAFLALSTHAQILGDIFNSNDDETGNNNEGDNEVTDPVNTDPAASSSASSATAAPTSVEPSATATSDTRATNAVNNNNANNRTVTRQPTVRRTTNSTASAVPETESKVPETTTSKVTSSVVPEQAKLPVLIIGIALGCIILAMFGIYLFRKSALRKSEHMKNRFKPPPSYEGMDKVEREKAEANAAFTTPPRSIHSNASGGAPQYYATYNTNAVAPAYPTMQSDGSYGSQQAYNVQPAYNQY